jgi:hypothetical protein
MRERNTENVVKLLRPALKSLHVQCLEFEPMSVRLSKYRNLREAGMGRCIVVARKTSFSDNTTGCLSYSYDRNRKIFIFIINVNENLCTDDSHGQKVKRKVVAVHEFVHSASALLLLSCLSTDVFIKKTAVIISAKVKLTTSDKFNSLLETLRELGKNGNITQSELLMDEHFRIDHADKFSGNYGDLYLNFLLSYQLLRETMAAIKRDKPGISFTELLRDTHKELVETKALQRDFVLGRIKTFLPRIFSDFA